MSIKLLLLRSGEEVITEVREMVNPDTKRTKDIIYTNLLCWRLYPLRILELS